MPGLFGILATSRRVSPQTVAAMGRRMADALRRRPWLRAELRATEIFCGGRVHTGVLNPVPQPLVTPYGTASVWFDGECVLPRQSTLGTPSAEAARELVSGRGPAIVDADGVFALAMLEEQRHLVLATDRLGFRPLYYAATADWFAYASEVKALLAILDGVPEIDEIALRQYFAFDHMLGDRTWWRDIRVVPPASIWRVSRDQTTRQRYWSFSDLRPQQCDPEEAHHEFARLWDRAVAQHHRSGLTPVLLSGGLDSRLLVAELLRQGVDVRAVTYGSTLSPEVRPARAVAKIAGIDHRVCEWNTRNWWHGREEAIWQTDGLVNANHLHPAIAMEEMRAGTCYSPMNIVGDLLFGGSHLQQTPWSELRDRPEQLMASHFVKNPFVTQDEALELSAPDIRLDAEGPSSDCVHLRERIRRYVLHSPGCFAPYCETVFPGVGLEFLQLFLAALPEEQRAGHRFYRRFLRERHRRFFGNVPWLRNGRGLWESPHVRVARNLQQRVRRVFGVKRRRTPSNQWFVDYPAAVLEHRVRERLLATTLLVDDLLAGAARAALRNDAETPLAAESLIAILTCETYLRQVLAMPGLSADPWLGGSHATGASGPTPEQRGETLTPLGVP